MFENLLGPQVMAVCWKVVEALGCGTSVQEMGHWEPGKISQPSPTSCLLCFLTVDAVWPTPSYSCHHGFFATVEWISPQSTS